VLTYFPTDYVHDNVSPTRISADFAESAQRNPGTTEMLDLYGIGDHGGGPTRAMLDQGDHWVAASAKADEAVPTMRYGTAQKYFSDVEGKLNPDSPVWDYDKIAKGYMAPPTSASGAMGVPTWKDELYFEYHRGVFTSQAAHKRNMRESETQTLEAEKYASMAWVLPRFIRPEIGIQRQYPSDQLTESWKKITFNQFHDLAAGSGIAVIYRDAQKDFTEVFRSDREITEGALNQLAAVADTRVQDNGIPIIVFNSLAWPRTEVVEIPVQDPSSTVHTQLYDSANHQIPTRQVEVDPITHLDRVIARVADVPAMGYRIIHAGKWTPNGPQETTDLSGSSDEHSITLQNSKLKAVIDKTNGCLTSIILLSTKKEFLAPSSCGNQLQAFEDTPKQYDAWNVDPGTLDKAPVIISATDVFGGEGDPVRASVIVKGAWQSSKFLQVISLDAGADFVRVDNTVDWHETHVLLKAAFPLAATSAKATYEIPFGSIERTTTRDNSWEKAKFEVPAQRWADLGDEHQGVSILNDSKYGYDAVGNTLRLTLLRSPTWPDPDADRGVQHFTYAIYPHAGTWKQAETVRRGYELNEPLMAQQVMPHTGTLPAEHSWGSVENRNVTLTAVKKAEDADALVYRMYEWAGTASEVKLHVAPGAAYAVESNLMEKVEGPHLAMGGDVVTVPIKPYEILTVQVFYPGKGVASKSAAN
jgi:alpha-mannosidase